MTIYNAGIAKDCCDQTINVYYDFNTDARRNNVHSLIGSFTATLEMDLNYFENPCELAGRVGGFQPCDSDPTDDIYPPQTCRDYYKISRSNQHGDGFDREYWQAICNNIQKLKSMVDGERTFKRSFLNNGSQTSVNFVWFSEVFEIATPEIRNKRDIDFYWLHECSRQIQILVRVSDLNPTETITAQFDLIDCAGTRTGWPEFCPEPNEVDLVGSIQGRGTVTRGPISNTSMVYPEILTAKNFGRLRYEGNKQELFDCDGLEVALNWNDDLAVYLSEWQQCHTQPFRLVGYPSISAMVGIQTIDFICPLNPTPTAPFVSLFMQYPSYPYMNYPISGNTGNGHGNYGTAGFFESVDGSGFGVLPNA